MNPRHRRLLIPGLLIALLVIVVVSAWADRTGAAERAPEPVSRISDPRIVESSGLVVSVTDDDLAYTVNDSGNDSVVFAIEISSGATVGTATPDVSFDDTEALSIDGAGTLWVADTGDNDRERDDVALYSLPEPGRGEAGPVAVTRYPLTYPDGSRDVEALVVNPRTDEKFLLTKGLFGGEVLALPDELVADRPNRVTALEGRVPGVVTDATFTPDGRHVVARTYSAAVVLDPTTWQQVATIALPDVEQGETLASEPRGDSLLAGSEGADSPLHRVAFVAPDPVPPTDDAPTSTPTSTPAAPADPPDDQGPPAGGNGFAGSTWAWAALVVVLLGVVSVAVSRR